LLVCINGDIGNELAYLASLIVLSYVLAPTKLIAIFFVKKVKEPFFCIRFKKLIRVIASGGGKI
jgi:hypothetical protein